MGRWDAVPEAFVLHAINRSEIEYVASLRRAWRRSPEDPAYRANRDGFGIRARPILELELPSDAVNDYQRARREFEAGLGVGTVLGAAREATLERADLVIRDVLDDEETRQLLQHALRGVSDPRLSLEASARDYRIEWYVDDLAVGDTQLTVTGWVFSDVLGRDIELALRDAAGHQLDVNSLEKFERPDVGAVFRGAPLNCGIRAVFDLDGRFDPASATLTARPVGSQTWATEASSRLWPRPA